MGTEIKVQHQEEVMQVRSRELQLENTEKLNNIVPVVETINEINLPQMELNTSEIKNIVSQNLEDQVDLDDIHTSIKKLEKSISSIKGQITKLSNKVDKILTSIEEGAK